MRNCSLGHAATNILPVGFSFMHLVIEKQANYLKVDMLRRDSKSKQLPVKPGTELWNLLRGQKSNEICLVDLFGRIYCFN